MAVGAAEGKRLAAQQQAIRMAVEADVRNAVQNVTALRSRLDAAESASKSAEDQYLSEQRQFQAGTSSVFLVLQRQTDLIAARSRDPRSGQRRKRHRRSRPRHCTYSPRSKNRSGPVKGPSAIGFASRIY